MRTRLALAALASILAAYAIAPVAAPGGIADHAASSAAPAERIRADVARLAAPRWEGRRAGSAGADRAADWIAGQFRQSGLRPAGTTDRISSPSAS